MKQNTAKKISNKNRNEDDDESQIQEMRARATWTGVPWVRFKRLHGLSLVGLAPKRKRSKEEIAKG